jgi:DNA repair protein RadC
MIATRVSWKMVKEENYQYFKKANEPDVIFDIASKILEGEAQENVLVFSLDTKLQVVGITNVSRGILESSLLHAREVFRPAILSNAAAIILVHNHPSGDPEPSNADKSLTKTITEQGDLLGIKLLDHVIVGDGKYYSFTAGRKFLKEG